MKDAYKTPIIDVIQFEFCDIITASIDEGEVDLNTSSFKFWEELNLF